MGRKLFHIEQGGQIKKNEMSWACGMHGQGQRHILDCGRETRLLGRAKHMWRIILKLIFI
jgi:hypothetical protein